MKMQINVCVVLVPAVVTCPSLCLVVLVRSGPSAAQFASLYVGDLHPDVTEALRLPAARAYPARLFESIPWVGLLGGDEK